MADSRLCLLHSLIGGVTVVNRPHQSNTSLLTQLSITTQMLFTFCYRNTAFYNEHNKPDNEFVPPLDTLLIIFQLVLSQLRSLINQNKTRFGIPVVFCRPIKSCATLYSTVSLYYCFYFFRTHSNYKYVVNNLFSNLIILNLKQSIRSILLFENIG